jgi:PAS domain S-box-containing protein
VLRATTIANEYANAMKPSTANLRLPDFSARLQDALKKRGMTQKELSDRILISPSTVTRWFTGGSQPQPRTIEAIANAIGVRKEWLLSGEGEPDLPPAGKSPPETALPEKRIREGDMIDLAVSVLKGLEQHVGTPEKQTDLAEVTTDPEGKIIYVNQSFSAMCGYSLSQLKGRKPGEVLQGEKTEPEKVEEFRSAMRERRPLECTITNYMRDGSLYRVHIKMFPVFDQTGELIQFKAIERKV